MEFPTTKSCKMAAEMILWTGRERQAHIRGTVLYCQIQCAYHKIGMDEVLAHYACIFDNSDLHFHFQSQFIDTAGIDKVNMYIYLKFGLNWTINMGDIAKVHFCNSCCGCCSSSV